MAVAKKGFDPVPSTLVIGEELDRGSFAVVYLASLDKTYVAVKRLHNALMTGVARGENVPLKKFKRECERLKDLNHPNVVRYIGTYEDNKGPLLVMELMYESLEKYLKRNKGRLSPERVLEICSSVCEGMAYLHGRDKPLIHRDLGSKNVLLTKKGVVKIADFGQAKLLRNCTGSLQTTQPGTIAYMPPEALKKDIEYTANVDSFSLGVLMLEICTQSGPSSGWEGINYEIEVKRRENDLSLLDDAHPLKPLVVWCLQHEKLRPAVAVIYNHVKNVCETTKQAAPNKDVVQELKEQLQDAKGTIGLLETQLVEAMQNYSSENARRRELEEEKRARLCEMTEWDRNRLASLKDKEEVSKLQVHKVGEKKLQEIEGLIGQLDVQAKSHKYTGSSTEMEKKGLMEDCEMLSRHIREMEVKMSKQDLFIRGVQEELKDAKRTIDSPKLNCTRTERTLEITETELEDTKMALKSERVCTVVSTQKDDQLCFCRGYLKKVEDLLMGIAGLVDCFCQAKTVMHQSCERGIDEGQKRMDTLEREVHSLANTLKGLSFKHPEAKEFLQEEVESEQDSLTEFTDKVNCVVKKLDQLKADATKWEKQRNLPVNVDSGTSGSTSSNSRNASVPKIEKAHEDVAVVTEHMRACSDASKEMDGHNEYLKVKHFQRLQSYVAEVKGRDDEIKEKDEEIGELRSKVVMLEERQAKSIMPPQQPSPQHEGERKEEMGHSTSRQGTQSTPISVLQKNILPLQQASPQHEGERKEEMGHLPSRQGIQSTPISVLQGNIPSLLGSVSPECEEPLEKTISHHKHSKHDPKTVKASDPTSESSSPTGDGTVPFPKTVEALLRFYQQKMLDKMDATAIKGRLQNGNIIPKALSNALSDTAKDTYDANTMLFQHAVQNCDFEACLVLCDVMRSETGYPKMNKLGEEMWVELKKNEVKYRASDL